MVTTPAAGYCPAAGYKCRIQGTQMTDAKLDPRLREELKDIADQGVRSGDFLTPAQIDETLGRFRARFGPAALKNTDGEALLRLMHQRDNAADRSLVYRLEFKLDDDARRDHFGGVRGGTAAKFGVYQRDEDRAWVGGTNVKPTVLTLDEAIAQARQQREELVAGDAALARLPANDTSDEAYARLHREMTSGAPRLSKTAWAHKYWALLHPDKIDDFHSPRYQRFQIFKMLQTPPDGTGILDDTTSRFVCAGRFVSAARELSVPVNTLTSALVKRNGGRRHYWRIGTTTGSTRESQWPIMRDGGFVSIGWPDHLPDLTDFKGQKDAKERMSKLLLPAYENAATASRKAGEVLKFIEGIEEGDLVLACEGQEVLGVGRVRGPYEHDEQLRFPHIRRVEWLLLDPWDMPTGEGLLTTVFELGRRPENIAKLEQLIFQRKPIAATAAAPRAPVAANAPAATPPPPLDPFTARVEAILRRKGQAIFYGPPGTGKTYRALSAARELAAGRTFRKRYRDGDLTDAEKKQIDDPAGLVRVCTFHPGYGYEDFIEGFRPRTTAGQMTFDLRDGIFKTLCNDAKRQPDRHFFLIVDEINRGDIPRIFGELMTVIERDKREMQITLPVSGSAFAVPKNVFIIGTMNTADRSISLLDTALRRRFGFVELMPDSKPLSGRKAGTIALGPWLEALNIRVRRHLKRDARNLQVGHAYLLPATSMAEFTRVLRDDIIPLLEEYCYEDFEALRGILGAEIVDVENGRIREEIFEPDREERLTLALMFDEMQRTAAEPAEETNGDDETDDDATPT
jgi:5-methylcytosine-specific restriction enzyme B